MRILELFKQKTLKINKHELRLVRNTHPVDELQQRIDFLLVAPLLSGYRVKINFLKSAFVIRFLQNNKFCMEIRFIYNTSSKVYAISIYRPRGLYNENRKYGLKKQYREILNEVDEIIELT